MSLVRTGVIPPPSDIKPWLERASAWMFASMALRPPSCAITDAMRGLVSSLPADMREEASRILELPLHQWEPEYFSVLGPAGCPACESSYERAAQASRGPLLADVAACYRAFGYLPEPLREVPDHVVVELDFLSFMAVKIAFARFEARDEDACTAREAYEMFRRRHLEAFAQPLCASLIDTGSPQYASIARFLQTLISRQDDPAAAA
jgi:nitrate reductase assembly molybdenum cofactor insertion protein NarJ